MAVRVSLRQRACSTATCIACIRTVGSIAANDTAHAHCRCAIKQTLGDKTVGLGDARETASDGEHAVMNALYHLADTGAYASLVAQVGYILACLANDDTSFLGRDNGAQCELRLGVLLLGARGGISCLAIDVQALELVGDRIGIASGVLGVFGGHAV